MKNIWFETNKKQIEVLKRQLLEHEYAGSYGGSINLMDVNNTIDGAIIEVLKLQKENDVLKEELKKSLKNEKKA